jgi:hypothetical protein
MITILAHGEDAFRLVNGAGKDVGWVRPRTIGFGGFGGEEAARAGTLAGARALAGCLKREFGVAHPELRDRPRLRTVRDGAGEWIVDGRVRIARLLRVESGQSANEHLAIEYTLPSYATDAVAINAAQIMYRVMSPEMTEGLDLRVVASMTAAATV